MDLQRKVDDYTALTAGSNDTTTIDANATSGTFEITITDDSTFEPDESFTVTISEVSIPSQAPVGISPTASSVEVTINDDDLPTVSFDVTEIMAPEGTTNTTLNIGYTLSHVPPEPVTIYYQTESTGTGASHAVGSADFKVPTIIDDSNFVTHSSGTTGMIPITIYADRCR